MEEASYSNTLILMGDLNIYLLQGQHDHDNPGVLWRAFVVTQVRKELRKGDALLDLMLSNQEKFQGKVKAASN